MSSINLRFAACSTKGVDLAEINSGTTAIEIKTEVNINNG